MHKTLEEGWYSAIDAELVLRDRRDLPQKGWFGRHCHVDLDGGALVSMANGDT